MELDDSSFSPFSGIDPFALAKVQEEKIDDGLGQTRELTVFESRYNKRGEQLALQVATVRSPPERGLAHESALLLTKFYDKNGRFEYEELEIKSPHIVKALREVIEEYPGVIFGAKRVLMRGLPKCIFHYQSELQTYTSNLIDAVAVQHIKYALEYMISILENQLLAYWFSVELDPDDPSLEFKNLWMVFRPGDLIYSKTNTVQRIYRLHFSTDSGELELEFVDFDGYNFGFKSTTLRISCYANLRKIRNLEAFPLRYHRDEEEIRNSLLARGRKFFSLGGAHYRYYSDKIKYGEESDAEESSSSTRIMVDSRSSNRSIRKSIPKARDGRPWLTNEQLIMCNDTVHGYNFSEMRWNNFPVDRIHDIRFNQDAYVSLLLPPGQKEIIHSLVEVHMNNRSTSEDVIKGKGNGLIFMLYGIPGVGKTLTAGKFTSSPSHGNSYLSRVEAIAECTQRPLYVVKCSDLGSKATSIEKNLLEKIKLAEAWKAVMLIDEADIFLEARRARDIQSNALVSVFLKILEYYKGILFLTTNRIDVCDAAIRSRVHLAIKYDTLSTSVRRDLLHAFINRISENFDPALLEKRYLEKLTAEEFNGREIKNLVRMAQALASTSSSRLEKRHLKLAFNVMKASSSDLADTERERKRDLETERGRKRRFETESEEENDPKSKEENDPEREGGNDPESEGENNPESEGENDSESEGENESESKGESDSESSARSTKRRRYY